MPNHKTIYKRKHVDPADLWATYQQTRSVADRNRLVEFYVKLGFVRAIALRMNMAGTGSGCGFTADDLESFGWHGLIRAVELFDPSRGFVFRTYAGQKITGAILDAIRKEGDPRPRLIRNRRAMLSGIVGTFAAEHGRKPTDDEIRKQARAKGLQPSIIECLLRDGRDELRQAPIDVHYHDSGDDVPLRILCQHTAKQLKRLEDREEIDQCFGEMDDTLRKLGKRSRPHAKVMEALYLNDYSQRDVARSSGMSPSRVSQIHTQTLRIMRAFAFAARKAQAA